MLALHIFSFFLPLNTNDAGRPLSYKRLNIINHERDKMMIKSGLIKKRIVPSLLMGAMSIGVTSLAFAEQVTVQIENLSSANGLFLTPTWVSFHNGEFKLFTEGAPASSGLEQLAEDGDATGLIAEFSSQVSSGLSNVLTAPNGFAGAPVFDPQDKSNRVFDLDPQKHRYFSYAAMVIPSNDAFIGNPNSTAYELFDEDGKFKGPIVITIMGNQVWDAGTEENTEMDAAFLNQTAPDAGIATTALVQLHPGFLGSSINAGSGIILGGSNPDTGINFDAIAADFTQAGYEIARITISNIPDNLESDDFSGGSVLNIPQVTIDRTNVFNNVQLALDFNNNTFGLTHFEDDHIRSYTIPLMGKQEVPDRVSSIGGALGQLKIDMDSGAIQASVLIYGVTDDTTAAHIHFAAKGENGPIIKTLVGAGEIYTLPKDSFLSRSELDSLKAGELYFNVHTEANPGGEFRGQISVKDNMHSTATLSGTNEVPSVESIGSGVGVLTVEKTTLAVSGSVTYSDLTNVTAAHVHIAMSGENGPVIITLESGSEDGQFMVPADTTLSEDQMRAFLMGHLYFNVHTESNAAGELRGQIRPALR